MSISAAASVTQPGEQIPWLDGLRGIAACWVLLAHVQILSGMGRVPILSWGEVAVDLFMLLSGFLMAHLALARAARKPWNESGTWADFWLRRFFRIAPLYYVLLAIAFLIGPWLGEMRELIAQSWPLTATPPARYNDQSLGNVLMHVSFIFGVLPDYAFNTPLPDWSIGLEMQFYLAFPLIMMLALRWGALPVGLGAMAVCLAASQLFPAYFASFEMPAMLLFKLHVFLFGSWIAFGRWQASRTPFFVTLAILFGLCAFERNAMAVGEAMLVIGMFYLMDDGFLPGHALLRPCIAWLRRLFSSRVARMLGDTSYSVYLVHLLILIPIAAGLSTIDAYRALPGIARFLLCLFFTAAPSWFVAMLLHRAVELPGVRLGAAVSKALGNARQRGTRPLSTVMGATPAAKRVAKR